MAKPRQSEPVHSDPLGLKQGYAITSMPVGSLLDVQNMNLDGKGGKSTRQGYAKIFELPVNEPVLSLYNYRTEEEVLAYADDTIYKWDGASVSSLVTGLTPDTRWNFEEYQERIYGVNGIDEDVVYDGTTTYTNGITAPAHVSLSVVAGGTLPVGDVSYVVTFYDSNRGAESNPPDLSTAPTATTTSGNQTITFNQPTATSGEQVTHIRVYRMKTGETVFTQIDEVAYSAGAPYSDAGLTSGSIEVETDTGQIDKGNTPPPTSKLILVAFNRLLLVDEDDSTLLVWSKRNQPHAFPSGNYNFIGEGDGARILKIERHGESVLIHKRNGVYILKGDPAENDPIRISGIGTHNFNTSQSDIDNLAIRLTPQGFHQFNPTQFDVADLREEYIGDDISQEETLIDWNNTNNVTMAFYKRGATRHVYAFFPNTSDYSTKCLVQDVTIGQWLRYKINTDVFCNAKWEDDAEEKMIFGDGYGMVWEWDTGEADGTDNEPDVINGTVTSATSTTMTDSTQSWTVDEFKGCIFTTLTGTGANQRRRIISNTSDTLTFDTALSVSLDTSTVWAIGAIHWYADEFWNDEESPNIWKRMRWIVPYVRQTGNFVIQVSFRRDFKAGFDITQELILLVDSNTALWGVMIWGSGFWGTQASNLTRLRFNGKYHYYSIRYENKRAAERGFWDGHTPVFQFLYDRNR